MKALRWTLFCLLAFGLGTGVALAVHPPTPGIPAATASQLSDDLAAVKGFAAEGRCNAVRGRLNGAQSRISGLPANTSEDLVQQLQQSLEQVRESALATCQQVLDARLADEQKKREEALQEQLEATTPTETPVAPTTPDPGEDDGAPDPGDEGTPPEAMPSTPDDSTGGVPVPDAVQQQLRKEREKWTKKAKAAQRELENELKRRLERELFG